MNLFDIIGIGIMIIFVIYGGAIGFINLVFSFIGIIIGSLIGVSIAKFLHLPPFITGIIFIIIVIMTGGIAHLAGSFLGKITRIIPGQRLTGMLLGLLIGVYTAGLVLHIISFFYNKQEFITNIENSILAKHIFYLFKEMISFIFKKY